MNNALIIFARNPVLGKVKTRLAKTMGDVEALRIYKLLLQHTRGVTCSLNVDKFVFYADHLAENDVWENKLYQKKQQEGADLGMRMQHAFESMFEMGYQSVCIIGSDCFELSVGILELAFESLARADTVIGPSRDGGYYLLGMRQIVPGIFESKQWSTDTVFTATQNDISRSGRNVELLPVLSDVDEATDLPPELLQR